MSDAAAPRQSTARTAIPSATTATDDASRIVGQASTPAGHVVNRRLRVADDHLADVLAGRATLLFDGAMGTQLQAAGLAVGAAPELLNLSDPAAVTRIHAAYVAAGAEVVTTNTFGANAMKLGGTTGNAGSAAEGNVDNDTTGSAAEGDGLVARVVAAGVACARAAGARYVAADIGPTGALLKPMGTLGFDEAYDLFAEQVLAATAAGADLFVIETMADLAEAKAALLAVKENSDLPAFVTMTFDADGRTFLGTTPEVAAATLSALGADALGANCGLGPAETAPLVERMTAYARCPVMAQANAGLPQVIDGVTTYDVTPDEYCASVAGMLDAGVTIIGGCCGTTPAFTAAEAALLARRAVDRAVDGGDAGRDAARTKRANCGGVATGAADLGLSARAACAVAATCAHANGGTNGDTFAVASAQRLVALAPGDVGVIGERINPTGKPKMKAALRSGNHDYVMSEAAAQERAGAQILDVNAGLPEIDERATMLRLVGELGGITTLPLQIDSADPAVVEAAVRSYAGKPIINSCNGSAASLAAMLPIARHYGCAIVGLTLDEGGIPATAEGRLAIARRIVSAADELGIPRCDVAIDCLAMAASTDQSAPGAILDAIRLVKRELVGVRCVLGVSNISFGLPARPLVNATFLAAALGAGLDLAIINPLSAPLADAVAAWRVLSGEDVAAEAFVGGYAGWEAGGGMGANATARPSSGGSRFATSTAEAKTKGGGSETPGTGNAAAALEEGDIGALVVAGRRDAVAAAVAGLLASGDGGTVRGEGAPTSGSLTAAGRGDGHLSEDADGNVGVGSGANGTGADEGVGGDASGDNPNGVTSRSDSDTTNATDTLTMHIINDLLIPALDEVGARFEAGTFFLPQLMAAAEAAKAGFDVLREHGAATGASVASKGTVVLATVKGDIHDIGKNIVRMLLENYGYNVVDLGRDVDPAVVADAVVAGRVRLCGLSALMTTTVPAMAETIDLLRNRAPWCKVVVGGAVLNAEYARMVGADYYARDAAATARIAAEVLG